MFSSRPSIIFPARLSPRTELKRANKSTSSFSSFSSMSSLTIFMSSPASLESSRNIFWLSESSSQDIDKIPFPAIHEHQVRKSRISGVRTEPAQREQKSNVGLGNHAAYVIAVLLLGIGRARFANLYLDVFVAKRLFIFVKEE